MSTTPRTEACIEAVMKRYPGISPAALARYFEAVHQELGPLARDLERELEATTAALTTLSQRVAELQSVNFDHELMVDAQKERIGELERVAEMRLHALHHLVATRAVSMHQSDCAINKGAEISAAQADKGEAK